MDTRFKLGNDTIDAQHKALYYSITQLAAFEDHPSNAERISDHMDRLTRILHQHFADEEKLMDSLGLPKDLHSQHIMAHFEIVRELTNVHFETMNGNRPSLVDLSNQIASWVLDHIVDFDMLLKPYIQTAKP